MPRPGGGPAALARAQEGAGRGIAPRCLVVTAMMTAMTVVAPMAMTMMTMMAAMNAVAAVVAPNAVSHAVPDSGRDRPCSDSGGDSRDHVAGVVSSLCLLRAGPCKAGGQHQRGDGHEDLFHDDGSFPMAGRGCPQRRVAHNPYGSAPTLLERATRFT